MDWIVSLTIAAATIYIIYNIVALFLFGVPESLSKTFYLYKDKWNWTRFLFPIMMVTVGILLLPAWIELSNGSNFQFLAFLAVCSILFVGTAPAFKSTSLQNNVHSVSAMLAAITSLLWILLVPKLWYVILICAVLLTAIAIISKTITKCYIYWLESIAFTSTFISIIMYSLV